MKLETKYISVNNYKIWNDFVDKHPYGTLFNKTTWLKNHSGDLRVFILSEKNIIVGGIAFLISKKKNVKGVFRPPYTPFYCPLVEKRTEDGNSEKEIEILDVILRELVQYKNISLMLHGNAKYFIPYKNNGFSIEPKLNYIIKEPTNFLFNVAKRKKSIINKYCKLKDETKLILMSDRNVDDTLGIWENFGKEKQINTYTTFLKELFNNSSFTNWECLKIFSDKGLLLASAIYIEDSKRIYNLIPVINYKLLEKQYRHIGDFLYFSLSEIAKEKNLIFDFEGSEVSGVEKMYRRLGGEIELKYIITKYDYRVKALYSVRDTMNKIKNLKRKS